MSAAIAALAVSTAGVVGSAISSRKARKSAEKQTRALNAQRAEELEENKKQAQKAVNAARGIVSEGDPTLAEKQRVIEKSAADVVGKATSTSGSTQEIINAAQKVNETKNTADNTALSQAAEFKNRAKRFLAERFTAAGQLRLSGQSVINQESQAALAAISANAQARVDNTQNTFSNIGSIVNGVRLANDAGAFNRGVDINAKPIGG